VENLAKSEITALLHVARNNEQHQAFILLAYHHAARRGELLNLRGTDVVNGHVRIVRLKQRKNPIVNVQPLAENERALVEQLASRAGTGRLFRWSNSYASRIIKTYLVASGIYTFPRRKSLHSLRHAAGHEIYQSCKDILAVSTHLGHRSVTSAQRYVHKSQAEINDIAANALALPALP
jgi:integrase